MRIVISLLLFATMVIAKSHLSSDIPTAQNRIINTHTAPCLSACLKEHLDNGEIFSFLAHITDDIADVELKENMMIYASFFNVKTTANDTQFKVALLIPKERIGKYATSTNSAVFAYLMAKNHSFEMKTFYLHDQSMSHINEALQKIQKEGFSYVIAPLTLKGAQNINALEPKLNIFFPTIHKSDLENPYKPLYFGGIDYEAQIKKLSFYAKGYAALFYDDSPLGEHLNDLAKQHIALRWLDFSSPITRQDSNLKHYFKDNEKLQEGTVFINTSTITSGIILSQLTLYDVQPSVVLSTQVNYDPLLLSITQRNDRKNLLVANSIEHNNNVLIEANNIINNDIVYDRINYATTVGIDLFLSMVTQEPREYSTLAIKDNQVIYPIEIYKSTLFGFKKVSSY